MAKVVALQSYVEIFPSGKIRSFARGQVYDIPQAIRDNHTTTLNDKKLLDWNASVYSSTSLPEIIYTKEIKYAD
ncbi:hypothetical protein QJ48_30460 [Paenibacillus sp. A3]|uniref:hypothetical protein n=1 Tax=Paenibacillus sp. A3 TaxID=1337054 RepID=UPI0006D59055|nr:hypothetical protein [Paenibacillus sp. A3]KPV55915.1 hypothetical protein QJ48_30460 [Paenibacillus sp. A3]